jgi:carbamoyltransferase
MWILGLSPSHDASAALLHDGIVIAAVAEERLTRIKGDGGGLPRQSIEQIFRIAGIDRPEVDCVAIVPDRFPEDCNARGRDPNPEPYLRARRFLQREGFRSDALLRCFDHHASHAMAAVGCSGFEDAAVVTVDGVGHLGIHHTSSVFREGTRTRTAVSDVPGTSAGWFYEGITRLLGFRPLRHEGKVLGLAAWGDPKPRADAERMTYLAEVIRAIQRDPSGSRVLDRILHERDDGFLQDPLRRGRDIFAGVAAGMSDTGNSIGAALLAFADLDRPAYTRACGALDTVSWGPEYDDAEIRDALDHAGLSYRRLAQEPLTETAARAVHGGLVVGWFQGRMELGPRAPTS